MGDRGSLLFVPFASSDPDTYTGVMRQTLAPRVLRSPASTRPGTLTAAVADAQAVFGGGGNSFRLLRTLTTLGVLEPLRQAAQAVSRTWWPARAPIWPARPSAPPTTCRSSSRGRWRRWG